MNDVLTEILYAVISIAIAVGGAYIVKLIRIKTNWQYKDEIADAVAIAVGCVQQTFVDRAKSCGKFDEDNQAKARATALSLAKELLSTEASDFLYKSRTEKEANNYLIALIEKAVRTQKKEGNAQ